MTGLVRRTARLPGALRRAFFGAIFQREVRALGRRRMPYWVRGGYTLLLIGLVSLVFLAMWDTGTGSQYARQSILEELAPAMLATVAFVQMWTLALIAPVLTAGAIADEKRQRTLSTLLTTPLTSRDIILGKLGARTVQLLILALVPMPLLLALRVFGGVEAEAILASMMLSIALAMLGASLALMFSIWHRRTPSVVFFALCSTAVLTFLPWLGMMITEWSLMPNENNFFFKCITPIAMLAVVMPESFGGPSVAHVRELWLASLGYLVLTSTAVVVFSIFVLRGVLRREAAGTSSGTAFTRLVIPGGETPKKEREAAVRDARTVGDRPVLWRELRQTAVGSGTRTILAAGLGIVILLFLYAIAGMGHPGLTNTLLVIVALGLTAQVALNTSASVSSERDAGSWSVLLTTPVKPRQVVLGKTLGAIRKLWLLPAVVGFHVALVMIAGWYHPIGVVHATILLGAILFMLASTGVCLGLMCKRGVTASVLNMGIPLVLFVGVPILAALFSIFVEYELGQTIGNAVMLCNPFVLLAESSTTATADGARYSYFLRYEMLGTDDTVTPLKFTGMVLMCSGGMAALGIAALAIAISGFNRWNGRPS